MDVITIATVAAAYRYVATSTAGTTTELVQEPPAASITMDQLYFTIIGTAASKENRLIALATHLTDYILSMVLMLAV